MNENSIDIWPSQCIICLVGKFSKTKERKKNQRIIHSFILLHAFHGHVIQLSSRIVQRWKLEYGSHILIAVDHDGQINMI